MGPIHTFLVSLTLLVLVVGSPLAEEQEDENVVKNGKQVSIEYTLKLDDGTTADSNVGGEPLSYQAGADQILPALDEALVGLKVEESKKVTLPPEQGYGLVDPAKFETVELSAIPEIARKPGAQLMAQDPNGNQLPVRVHEVSESTIVLDLNHPLAGQNLNFEIKIVAVE